MSVSRTIDLQLSDIPNNDLSLQLLLLRIKDGMKIPIANDQHPDEIKVLSTLQDGIKLADYSQILFMSKDPLFHQRLLRLRLGFNGSKIDEDQFRTIMIISYFQALNLPVTVQPFSQTDKEEEKNNLVSPAGQSWMEGMSLSDSKNQEQLISESRKLVASENSIIIAELDPLHIVATCLVLTTTKHSAVKKRLLPILEYFNKNKLYFSLKDGRSVKDLLNNYHKDNEIKNFFSMLLGGGNDYKLFKEELGKEYPQIKMFSALIDVSMHLEPVMINDRPCVRIASTALFKRCLAILNPANKVTYAEMFGTISPLMIENHGRDNRRLGNLFMNRIDNPTTAHGWLTAPAWYVAHDFYYHFYLVAMLSHETRQRLFQAIDSIRCASNKSSSHITHAIWELADQELHTDSSTKLYSRVFEGTSPEEFLVSVNEIINSSKSKSLVAQANSHQFKGCSRNQVEKDYAKTKSREKTAALSYMRTIGLSSEADRLAEISKQFPDLDWLKWKKVFAPHNCLYPMLQNEHQTIILWDTMMALKLKLIDLHKKNSGSSFLESMKSQVGSFIKSIEMKIPKDQQFMTNTFKGKLECRIQSLCLENKSAEGADILESALSSSKISTNNSLYDNLRKSLDKVKDKDLRKWTKEALTETYNEHILDLMHNVARIVLCKLDKIKHSAGICELSTNKPLMGTASQLRSFDFFFARNEIARFNQLTQLLLKEKNPAAAAKILIELKMLKPAKLSSLHGFMSKIIDENQAIKNYLDFIRKKISSTESKQDELQKSQVFYERVITPTKKR